MPPRNFLEALGGTLSDFGRQVPGLLQQDVQSQRLFDQDRLTQQNRLDQQAQIQGRFDTNQRRLSQPKPEKALTANQQFAEFLLGNPDAQKRFFESKISGRLKPTSPKTPTPLSFKDRGRATEDVFEQQQLGTLGEANRFSLGQGGGEIGSIEELETAAAGLGKGDFNFFSANDPKPDTTLSRLRDQFNQIGSPAHRQAFQAGDSLRTLRPSLFQQGQQQPVQPFDPGQGGLIGPPAPQDDPIEPAVQGESMDSWGARTFDGWKELNTQGRIELFNAYGKR